MDHVSIGVVVAFVTGLVVAAFLIIFAISHSKKKQDT